MNRRHFFMSSLAAGAMASTSFASPNDRVRIACVGVRGQGKSHIGAYSKMDNVEIAAVCDIDESILSDRLNGIEKAKGKRPAAFTDIRKLLEDKSIDAISIATPNHSHTLQTIWACQAGKHVYVEKPCSHNIFESKQIVAAAQKYDRLVQHGVNARSSPGLIEAVQKLKDGVIGDVYLTRGLCYKWRDTIGHAPVEPVPAGVHYDSWLGPAPKHEFTKNRFHYNWHWFWDYGNGDFGNQGIHEVDICRWGLGVNYPSKISAIGGHFMFDDDQETPNTLAVAYEFNEGGRKRIMEFEVRHWISNHEAGIGKGEGGNTVGNVFYGSKGYMAIDGYNSYKTYLGKEQQPGPAKSQGGNNWANFVDALRSGKKADLNNPIEEGAKSATLMHLANISYRLGRTLNFDSTKMEVVGDAEANRMFTRKYRAPFVVPEKV
ncbi:MAG TPA: Gfo/Idh/MocA family oxidoreductase [Bryobacteraceae bacterium]|nr:Gfo/Idh/MocA family oxidoreductase [Bryobacteraceae bacterium]